MRGVQASRALSRRAWRPAIPGFWGPPRAATIDSRRWPGSRPPPRRSSRATTSATRRTRERVLAQLEHARPRLQRRLGAEVGELAVVLHPTSAQLDAAQPWLPLAARADGAGGPPLRRRPGDRRRAARARAARAGRARLQRRGLARAADARPHRAARQAPAGARARRRRGRRAAPADVPWRLEGAAQFFSGQTPPRAPRGRAAHARAARSRASRPRAATRCCSAAPCSTCSRARRARRPASSSPARPTPRSALERAFHGRPLRQTEQAWRSHLAPARAAGLGLPRQASGRARRGTRAPSSSALALLVALGAEAEQDVHQQHRRARRRRTSRSRPTSCSRRRRTGITKPASTSTAGRP